MLEVQNLSVEYRGVKALESVSLVLRPGELVGLLGPNGAGKSSLIKAILGLARCRGQILFRGAPLQWRRRQIAYVPQRSQIDWDYPITAWDVAMMSQTARAGWLRRHTPTMEWRVAEALERVDMLSLKERPIGQLSGGQQQRIFLARALAQQADLFLLDEPFTGIDKRTEGIMLGLFAQLKAEGKTLLVCSHEWGESLNRYDRLLLLNRQLLADDTPQAVMTLENIRRAFGENLPVTTGNQRSLPFFC